MLNAIRPSHDLNDFFSFFRIKDALVVLHNDIDDDGDVVDVGDDNDGGDFCFTLMTFKWQNKNFLASSQSGKLLVQPFFEKSEEV